MLKGMIPRHLTPIIIVSIIFIYRYLTVRWLAIGTNVCNVHKGHFVSTEILFGFFLKLFSWKSWSYISIVMERELLIAGSINMEFGNECNMVGSC